MGVNAGNHKCFLEKVALKLGHEIGKISTFMGVGQAFQV